MVWAEVDSASHADLRRDHFSLGGTLTRRLVESTVLHSPLVAVPEGQRDEDVVFNYDVFKANVDPADVAAVENETLFLRARPPTQTLTRVRVEGPSRCRYVLLTRRIRRDRVGCFGRTGRGWIVLDGVCGPSDPQVAGSNPAGGVSNAAAEPKLLSACRFEPT